MPDLSKIILGTVQLGVSGYGINNSTNGLSAEESFELLGYAHQSGIQMLDTASAYGEAEQIIGAYQSDCGGRAFRIITKIDPGASDSIQTALNSSLTNLNTTSLDTLLFHSFADYKKKRESIPQLAQEVEKGRIKNLGVSVYTEAEARELLNEKLINTVQLPYNLLDNFSRKGGLLKDLKSAGKIVHVRSVFLQGLFFKKLNRLPVFLEPLRDNLKNLNSLSVEHRVGMNHMAMGYALSNKDIDGVLIGVDSLNQLKDNIKELSKHLPEALISEIDRISVSNESLLNPVNWK